MKYYRFLFLAAGICYLGCFLFTDGLVFTNESGVLTSVSSMDPGWLNDNLSLLFVAGAAILTFGVLTVKKFTSDGLILVTVLSFLLQFGSFAWIEHGSIYSTALGANNYWLLAGLTVQSVILLVVTYLIVVR